MRQAFVGIRSLAIVVIALGMVPADAGTTLESTPADFIVPTSDRACDEFNRSWVIESRHTHLSIKVQVRWSAVGGKERQEEFILSPGDSRIIGCASMLEVLSAEILPF